MSCRSDFYSKSFPFANDEWRYDDPISFSFDIVDTTKTFDIILKVDHTDQYPYQNLYVKTTSQIPGDTAIVQNLSLELANQAGFWIGSCSGANCTIEIPIQSRIHFNQLGLYQIDLEQYTRTDTLKGLSGLGLRVVEVQ